MGKWITRTYEEIKEYLEKNSIEGIVFYRGNGVKEVILDLNGIKKEYKDV